MPLFKKFTAFAGINNRDNDLIRQDDSLRDALNVMIEDSERYGLGYRKRPGFFVQHNVSGNNGLANYLTNNELLLLYDTPRIWNGSGMSIVKTVQTDPLSGAPNQIADWAEINDVIYIAKEGKDLLKYDGHKLYKAGLPKAHVFSATNSGGGTMPAGDYQYIFEFEYTDKKGNTVISDSGITDVITQGANGKTLAIIYPVYQNEEGFAVTLTPDIDGFNSVFAEVVTRYPDDGGAGTATDSNPTITIPVLAGHTVLAGDRVYLRHTVAGFNGANNPKDLLWESFEVTSVAATSITVSNPRNLAVFVLLRPGSSLEVNTYITSVLMNVYRAYNGGAGPLGDYFYFESIGKRIGSTFSVKYEDTGFSKLVTQDPYISPEFLHIPPYQSKYVEYHKNILFQAGAKNRIVKTDGSFLFEDEPHRVFYSSTDGFASIENFVLGTNNILVGDNKDGKITALHSHNDFLIIFKRKAIYYLSGNVISGAFRIDKVHGSEVGCVCHGSVQEAMGAVLFLSDRGVYATVGGGSPKDISDPVTPLFLDPLLDKEKSCSAFSFSDQRYYLFVPFTTSGGRMFVYEVEHGAWLIWDVQAEGGLAIYGSEIYASTNGDLIREQSLRTDSYLGGAGINAYLFSNFESLGNPSIYKKFTNVKLFSLSGPNSTVTVQSFKDWDDQTVKTNNSINFTASQRFDKVKVLAGDNKAHSFAVKFQNDTAGEDMLITGWELEYEAPYSKIKE